MPRWSMFTAALLAGSLSYIYFFLGLAGSLSKQSVLFFSALYLVILFIKLKPGWHKISFTRVELLLLAGLLGQCTINFLGALGPELAFDALWYHLTIPKIWLNEGSIFFIPGSVYKYSVMPKLIDLLFFPAIAVGNEVWARLTHYLFGLLVLSVTYKLSRQFLSRPYSLLAVFILSSNLVFAWQSTTAYIDLGRSFFEILALYEFSRRRYWQSAVSLGLAVASKLLAAGSLPIFLLLVIIRRLPALIFSYAALAVLIPLPWLLLALISTGNPFYPFFTPLYQDTAITLNPADLLRLFTVSSDPVSPVYLIVLPVIIGVYRQWSRELREILLYCLLALAVWFITPRTGGGRFILPYLPAWSVIAAAAIASIRHRPVRLVSLSVVILVFAASLVYRTAANFRYFPYITGSVSKHEFLVRNLNFASGDYIDAEGFLSRTGPADRVLVSGINNLYYLDTPFIHEQFLSKNEQFNHLLIRPRSARLPSGLSGWTLVGESSITDSAVYCRQCPDKNQ